VVATVVEALVDGGCCVHRKGDMLSAHGGPEPGLLKGHIQGTSARADAAVSEVEVRAVGQGCQREPDDQEQREQQSNTVVLATWDVCSRNWRLTPA